MNRRYRVRDAIETIPWVSDTTKVTDIVFQLGLNDLRKGCSPDEIQEETLEMQMKYVKYFPNARQHLTALPPLGEKHNKVNNLLQKLASFTESNFISTKEFCDKATGKLRTKLMKDPSNDFGRNFHYSEWGVCILSKEIKKSLYSRANLYNECLTAMSNIMTASTATPSAPTPTPTPESSADPTTVPSTAATTTQTPIAADPASLITVPPTTFSSTDIDVEPAPVPAQTAHTNAVHTHANKTSANNVVPTSNQYESLDNSL